MKIMEIILFLFIFSLVMNGLSILRLTSSSYTTNVDVSQPDAILIQVTTQITVVLVAGIGAAVVTWIALAAIPLASGGFVPIVKFTGYAIFAGLVTTTLFGSITTIWNMYESVPSDLRLGATVVMGIFVSIIGILVTIAYVELTTEKEII